MKKFGDQRRFKETINFIDQELNIISKNPSYQRLQQIQPQLKKLDKTIARIEDKLMSDRRLNRTDVKNRLRALRQQRNEVNRIFQEIQLKLQKEQLTKQPLAQTPGKSQNYKLLDQLQNKNVHLERDFQTAGGIVAEAKNQLLRQREKVTKLDQQWQQADVELTMIEQFMKMISNRNFLTKIILIFLAIFLGLADMAIIIMKIF